MTLPTVRLHYTPDEFVFINQSYQATFEDFDADCTALTIDNPLTLGTWLYYTPANGVELIDEDGRNSSPDNGVHAGMLTVVEAVSSFVSRMEARQAQDPTPPETMGTIATPATGTITGYDALVSGNQMMLSLTVEGVEVDITDAGGSGSYGSQLLYTFPDGIMLPVVGSMSIEMQADGTGVTDTATVAFGIGTDAIAAPADGVVAGTQQDVINSDTITLSDGTGTKQALNIAISAGTMTSEPSIYLNLSGNAAGVDGNGTVTVNATITVYWYNFGVNPYV